MNLLPGFEKAVIERSKLVDYALNPQQERGRHKARVFESALGFNLSNWEQLQQTILEALPYHEAFIVSETVFGIKYRAVLLVTGANGHTASLMTIWQFDRLSGGLFSEVPRLVTLYIV